MAFTQPSLPYAPNALEPSIDLRTMEIHHGKHHAAYVKNLNVSIDGRPDLEAMTIEDLCRNLDPVPDPIRIAVRNNGGGHFNHSLFWTIMGPSSGGAPTDALADAIGGAFGDFGTFKEKFSAAAARRFGSEDFRIIDNPLMCDGDGPINLVRKWYSQFMTDIDDVREDQTRAREHVTMEGPTVEEVIASM